MRFLFEENGIDSSREISAEECGVFMVVVIEVAGYPLLDAMSEMEYLVSDYIVVKR